MEKIAVVILNWNGKKLLEQFLPTIIKYSPETSIYIADNASTDDSIAYIKLNFPYVKIVQNNGNYGFAKGYNEALKHIKAEIYALVNSDIEVTKDWTKSILEQFANEPQTAVIQPKIKDYKNKEHFEYAGAAGGFLDQYGYAYCKGRIFDSIEIDNGQYENNDEIFWASGACFFIRSAIYHELGGFDEDFFAHQEEIDLCWRLYNKGFKIKYNPYSTVYHVGGATLQLGNPKKTYLNFRNSLYMLVKNLPREKYYSVMFLRLVLDGIAGIKFVFQGEFKHFLAVLKAHFSFYKNYSYIYKKRGKNQSNKYYKLKSIVYLYYIKKIKIFTAISSENSHL
ncbi:MAG TPA: glycosyltransferase family 2 protein [Flavobacterium sp.]|nr:glycosyltransferase family 2 protein [Flavobacterium sp.]